ncbi:hypothetical protein ASD85_03880 [Rhizobium sp. Root651]|nr:hypothetical protein ASD85_03880 [Rhizobium sp. Root651]
MVLQRLFEFGDAFGIDLRPGPPGEEIRARRKFDVIIAEFGNLAAGLGQRKMSEHVGIERMFHGCFQ